MIEALKRLFPHEWRQEMKRRLFAHQDMRTRLENLRRAGFSPSGVIDGGAYRGDWTVEFWNIWPDTPVLMVEPQPGCRELLERVATKVSGSSIASCALGDSCGVMAFTLGESNSGIRASKNIEEGDIEVPVWTLDALLEERSHGFSPDFLKLDLQGYELHALRGAGARLAQFEVVLLEISILRIGDVPIFREVDRFMEEWGYRIYDIIPQYYRPRDGALWQMDAFYVREESALIASRAWG